MVAGPPHPPCRYQYTGLDVHNCSRIYGAGPHGEWPTQVVVVVTIVVVVVRVLVVIVIVVVVAVAVVVFSNDKLMDWRIDAS